MTPLPYLTVDQKIAFLFWTLSLILTKHLRQNNKSHKSHNQQTKIFDLLLYKALNEIQHANRLVFRQYRPTPPIGAVQ